MGRPRIKGKNKENPLVNLFTFLQYYGNKNIIIARIRSDMSVFIGVQKGKDFFEIPNINDLYFELGSYFAIFKKIVEYGYPVSAIDMKSMEKGLFENL